MRITIHVLVFLFISFLSMPTIITLIEKKVDVSLLLSTSEEKEELQKEVKEIVAPLLLESTVVFCSYFPQFGSKILNLDESNLVSVSLDIVIPPPKMV
jgi:hypothetical protein